LSHSSSGSGGGGGGTYWCCLQMRWRGPSSDALAGLSRAGWKQTGVPSASVTIPVSVIKNTLPSRVVCFLIGLPGTPRTLSEHLFLHMLQLPVHLWLRHAPSRIPFNSMFDIIQKMNREVCQVA
jgi:hypothetical protein